MSGLRRLEAHIEVLLWAADQLEGRHGEDAASVRSLRHMAEVLSAARDLVRPDYAAEDEAGRPQTIDQGAAAR